VADSITATITILRTGAAAYLQSREHDRQTADTVRRDSAELLARALHPANINITSYPTHVDVHFRTDDGASGTTQIHGLQDTRIAIPQMGIERLTRERPEPARAVAPTILNRATPAPSANPRTQDGDTAHSCASRLM
jgi:hypothetical protein